MEQHQSSNSPDNGQKQRVKLLIARILAWTIFESWDHYLTHVMDRTVPIPYPLAIWNQTHWVVIYDSGSAVNSFDPFSNLQDAYLIFQRGWPLLHPVGIQEVITHLFADPEMTMDPETYLSLAVQWSASMISTALYTALLVQDSELERLSLMKQGVHIDGEHEDEPHHLFE